MNSIGELYQSLRSGEGLQTIHNRSFELGLALKHAEDWIAPKETDTKVTNIEQLVAQTPVVPPATAPETAMAPNGNALDIYAIRQALTEIHDEAA